MISSKVSVPACVVNPVPSSLAAVQLSEVAVRDVENLRFFPPFFMPAKPKSPTPRATCALRAHKSGGGRDCVVAASVLSGAAPQKPA